MNSCCKVFSLVLILMLATMPAALAYVDSNTAYVAVSGLLSASKEYTHFALCDLDLDGNMEVLVSDMVNHGGWQCDVYTLTENGLEFVCTMVPPLGNSLVLKVLDNGQPHWFRVEDEAWQGYQIREISAFNFSVESGCNWNPLYKMEGQGDVPDPQYLYSLEGTPITQQEYEEAMGYFTNLPTPQSVNMADYMFINDWDMAWQEYSSTFGLY